MKTNQLPSFSEKNKTISFYDTADEYFEFSNFYPRVIKIDRVKWLSTEHYYQAQKFKYYVDKEMIRTATTPKEAFLLGRNLNAERVKNWHVIKVVVMETALHTKFTRHSDLKTILLNTQNYLIQEKSAVDSFWGIGSDGQGKNMMGVLLMELRHRLRKL